MASRSYALGMHRGARRRMYWTLGLVGAAAAVAGGVWYYETHKLKSNTAKGTYWESLSSSEQDAYKAALWGWVSGKPGEWPQTVESPTTAGITSQASLDDQANLAFATDAFQQARGISPVGGPGMIDQATYNAVLAG